jgi:RNA polymerase sigma-70 factor (ECF subfamily)
LTDDEALIRAAQAGDAQAFEQLLEQHYETLYRFAYKWCGNRADAEDVTQQACLKLARVLASYRFESAFTSWLYRVVINCAKDWARHEGRHTAASVDENLQAQDSTGGGNTVEHLVYLRQLLHKLDSLPEGLKETLLLVHGEGLTHSEAARVLEVKDSTVSWRLHEFRKHYRLSLNEGGFCE